MYYVVCVAVCINMCLCVFVVIPGLMLSGCCLFVCAVRCVLCVV